MDFNTNQLAPWVCIHGHRISLPLLADFPSRRIDINPHREMVAPGVRFGHYHLGDIRRGFKVRGPILLFLDSWTVTNVDVTDIEEYAGEVVLFLGDTQHGPHEGFRKLQRIAAAPCVSTVFFVNNPHHAHWFARRPADFDRFYFLPVGFANHATRARWDSPFLSNSVVYVGNVLAPHRYRAYLLEYCKRRGFDLVMKRTHNYQEANDLHRSALASLNVSLNGDLSFRLAEIIGSGGFCISDALGFVQKKNFEPFLTDRSVFFEDANELEQIFLNIDDIVRDKSGGGSTQNEFAISSDADIWAMARKIEEPRGFLKSERWLGQAHEKVDDYLDLRDICIRKVDPGAYLTIKDDMDRGFLLACLDLPRLRLYVNASSDMQAELEEELQILEARSRVTWDMPAQAGN